MKRFALLFLAGVAGLTLFPSASREQGGAPPPAAQQLPQSPAINPLMSMLNALGVKLYGAGGDGGLVNLPGGGADPVAVVIDGEPAVMAIQKDAVRFFFLDGSVIAATIAPLGPGSFEWTWTSPAGEVYTVKQSCENLTTEKCIAKFKERLKAMKDLLVNLGYTGIQ